jgi:hypothetical protein
VNESLDGFEEEDEFKDDPETKSVLAIIDGVIAKRTPQESYDWLCDLEDKIMDRSEAVLYTNSEVRG